MEAEFSGDPLQETVAAVRDYVVSPSFKRFASDFSEQIGDAQSVSVISQFDEEGKSFLSACLAVAFTAFFGKKVVVVDTSVKSREDSVFPLLFSRIADIDPQLKIEVATPDAFAGGSGHPIEFRFKHVVSALKSTFDIVIVDTSSVFNMREGAIDPVVISRNCDGALILSSIVSLQKKIVKKLSNSLRVSGVRILGSVYIGEPR